MAYSPELPPGQAVMASSAPVVIASNQSAIPVSGTVTATGQVDSHPVESTGTSLVLTTGGQTGVKVMIVGDGDKYVRGNVAEGAAVSDPVYIGVRDASGFVLGLRSGQQLAASSLPVVLTAAQITTLTPPAAITGFSTLAEQQTQTTALQLIDNAVSGAGFNITQQGGVAVSLNTGVRDTGTQRVTIATNDVVPVTDNSGSLTVDNNGTFVVQENGAALTSLQLIDDTIITDNNAFTDGTTKVGMAGFIFDEVAGTALTENDAAAARIDSKRSVVTSIEGRARGEYAIVQAQGSWAVGIDTTNSDTPVTGKALTVNSKNHQIWSNEHPQNDPSSTGEFYPQNQSDTGELHASISTIKGTQIPETGHGTSTSVARTFPSNVPGSLRVAQAGAPTATLANVSASASSVTIQAASTIRAGLILYNDSSSILYLKYGSTASATSFTYYVGANTQWEMPMPMYSGIVTGIWASATGSARVTQTT